MLGLETDRLTLRRWHVGDFDSFADFFSDPASFTRRRRSE